MVEEAALSLAYRLCTALATRHACMRLHFVHLPAHATPSCKRAGAQVDMDPARLTLGDLLSVHMEQRADAVAIVCAAALKELTIEAELRKIAEAWRGQRFMLHRYMRGAADERGWLLKGVRGRFCSTACTQ